MKITGKLFAKFKSGESPMLGIWIVVVCGVLAMFLMPWLLTRHSSLPSFDGMGPIGDTFNGIAGPFIALGAALLTYLAFWVQYQANQEQKKQFLKQSQDQIFFKLLDKQETKIINSKATFNGKEKEGFQVVENVVKELKKNIEENYESSVELIIENLVEEFGDEVIRGLVYSLFPTLEDRDPVEFEATMEDYRQKLNALIGKEAKITFFNEYLNNKDFPLRGLKSIIFDTYFYDLLFEFRKPVYTEAFNVIERKYSGFLDGYLRCWESIAAFCEKSIEKDLYLSIIKSQLSKYEMIIIFYYIASGYADDDFKTFVKEYGLLNNIHFYYVEFTNEPDSELIKKELNLILN